MHAALIFHAYYCAKQSLKTMDLYLKKARRLKQWQDGDLDDLYKVGKALQICLTKGTTENTDTYSQQFKKQMNTGKISSAIAKLTDTSKDVLLLDEIVKNKTIEKIFILRTI